MPKAKYGAAAVKPVNTFFGRCACDRPGLYYAMGKWFCDRCRPLIWPVGGKE
jgi:hypothetical protein